VLDISDKQRFINEINPYPYQRIYFSFYDYGTPYTIFDYPSVSIADNPEPHPTFINIDMDTEVLLVCAIAKVDYLVDYLASKAKSVTTMAFEDHRLFSNYDIAQFKRLYDNMIGTKKIIITTEKDIPRLELHKDYIIDNRLIIYALPIQVNFHFDEKDIFNDDIKKTLLDFKV
jgi:tetraacyldisaccharide 4'-kinase